MSDVINLRMARKRADRRKEEERASANRIAHGLTKAARKLDRARKEKAHRELESHRLDKRGDQ
ncbi:MAG TPA: DUF4169 family protein [Pseudolabrys sp.]|jgi:hypothetical protein|nr:DUF4169 family protein [Pseudolabrys sp.]